MKKLTLKPIKTTVKCPNCKTPIDFSEIKQATIDRVMQRLDLENDQELEKL